MANNYEKGQYATIALAWNDSAKELTIGARTGSFSGMPATRTFNIVFVDKDHGAGGDVTATADQSVKYDGAETKVSAK